MKQHTHTVNDNNDVRRALQLKPRHCCSVSAADSGRLWFHWYKKKRKISGSPSLNNVRMHKLHCGVSAEVVCAQPSTQLCVAPTLHEWL